MALNSDRGWGRFYEPLVLPTVLPDAKKIPPYVGRYVPVYIGKFEQTSDPKDILGEVIEDWVHDFVREHKIAEMRICAYMGHLTFQVHVHIDLHITREQEFILRLEKSHLLPR